MLLYVRLKYGDLVAHPVGYAAPLSLALMHAASHNSIAHSNSPPKRLRLITSLTSSYEQGSSELVVQ